MNKLIIIAVASVVVLAFGFPIFMGAYPFGPQRVVEDAKVQRAYIDYSGDKDSQQSHYMIGTDKGVFEVDNSTWLWIWNADEIYSQVEEGKVYDFHIKGNKIINPFFQIYPGVTKVEVSK